MGDLTFNQLCGVKIREAREAKGMSQEDLAFALSKEDYEKILKLVRYWEKGNGFPDLEQIYKLAEILEMDPNLIMQLRENGRKSLSEAKRLTDKQVMRRDRIERNLDDLALLFPALMMALVFVFLFKGGDAIWGFFESVSRFFGFIP
ncbi:MAG: helix-turn-helix domain-containing protein [Clostridia bacterium]|nr:helix-turn-helix domain-containing protein [Clostridia bacterium]